MNRGKKMLTRLLVTGMISVAALGGTGYAKETVSGQVLTVNKPNTYYTQGMVYVPAASMFKALKKNVVWQAKTKQLIVGNNEIIITLGNKQVKTNKGIFYLTDEPVTRQGRLYIPLRFFADIMGYKVSYKDGNVKIQGQQQIGVKGSYEQKLSEKRITISAAGDFTLGSYKGQSLGGRFDEVAKKNGYAYFMKGVKPIFEKDNLTIVNLEGPLTTRGVAAEKEFAIRGLPEYTQILTSGSIEAANLANNHTYDYQKIGYQDTVAGLEKSNIGWFGENNTYYTTVNGVSVAMIGAKGWSNTASVKLQLKKRISEAKIKADVIIVEFHWGEERHNYPNAVQQDLAKYVIDQGANLVLGSHPHVIQGIGSYKGVDIVYSMGNFCFGANKNPSDKDTFIYQTTFVITDAGVRTENSEAIPCSISSTSSRNDYQPTVLTGKAKQTVLNRLIKYSEKLKD